MKNRKRIQAFLSALLCGAMLLSSAVAVSAKDFASDSEAVPASGISEAAGNTNLALNKPYQINDASDEYDQNYPDSGGELTNGVFAESASIYNSKYTGLHAPSNGSRTVIIDLGKESSVSSITVSSLRADGYGVQLPQSVSASFSMDKNIWGNLNNCFAIPSVSESEKKANLTWNASRDPNVPKLSGLSSASVKARYVKLTFHFSYWCFVDEIMVYGSEGIASDAVMLSALSYQKPYTIEGPGPHASYPDSGRELTDGYFANNSMYNGGYTGLYYAGIGDTSITIDLGSESSVSSVQMSQLYDSAPGLGIARGVSIAFSMDGNTWSTLENCIAVPPTPGSSPAKVVWGWDASADSDVPKPAGKSTVSVKARYVKVTVAFRYWCFLDEITVYGVSGTAEDQVTLSPDDPAAPVVYNYMQKGEHTANIGHLALFYNGYYANGLGDWDTEEFIPYLVHEDLETGEVDTMFDGALILGLRGKDGEHTFQGIASADESANIVDFRWYLDKTLGPNGDVAHLNEAAAMAGQLLDDPDYKLKVVLNVPGVSKNQSFFGALPGTTKNLDFNPVTNPNGYNDDQVAAITWYNSELLAMWEERNFEHLELVGLYLLEEEIKSSTPFHEAIIDFIHENQLKAFWIPYYYGAGNTSWKKWGFDAAALQPNYTFTSGVTPERIRDAARLADEFNMGLELELDGVSEQGVISADQYNRYIEYMNVGVEKGFDGDKAYKAYYQDVKSLLHASQSDIPRIRHLYDATYQFIKGTYQRGYLQYLNEENVTAGDIADIDSVITSIDTQLSAASGKLKDFLTAEKTRLQALRNAV